MHERVHYGSRLVVYNSQFDVLRLSTPASGKPYKHTACEVTLQG